MIAPVSGAVFGQECKALRFVLHTVARAGGSLGVVALSLL